MVESEGGTEKVYRKLLNEENTRDIARTSEKVEGPRELIRRDDMTKALQMFWKGKEIQWRPWGRPCITWLSTIQQDLRSHNLTLPEAVDMTQNWSLWRMWLTCGATQSWVVARNDNDNDNGEYLMTGRVVFCYRISKGKELPWNVDLTGR